jgi:hypothetical protein
LEWLRIAGFGMLLVAMPFSNNWMSIASFVIAGVWILERIQDTAQKQPWSSQLSGFIKNKPLVLFTSVYFLLILGLAYTSDFKYAAWDLQMKLPLVFMPLVVSTLRPLSLKIWDKLWIAYLLALSVAVTVGLMQYFHVSASLLKMCGVKNTQWTNVREVSVYISHIRFSLMLLFGLCVMWLRFYRTSIRLVLMFFLSFYFLYFLWIIESATAYAMLLVLLGLAFLQRAMHSRRRALWLSALAMLIIVPTTVVSVKVVHYFTVQDHEPFDASAKSAGGEAYFSLPESKLLENGHYVFRYIAWDELRRSWKAVSGESLDEKDALGNPYYGTVVRYLTSKGMRKDSVSVYALSQEDIARVKSGVTNVEWKNKTGLEQRIDRILYEIDSYRDGSSANGHSVLQRLEFWRVGWHITKKNVIIGVGTGDVKSEYTLAYEELHTKLDAEHRLRAHNQYLTFFIAFGCIGGLWFVWVNVQLWRSAANRLVLAYLVIVLLSYLTEDTLETQAGVTFVVFLTSVLFSVPAARQLPQE